MIHHLTRSFTLLLVLVLILSGCSTGETTAGQPSITPDPTTSGPAVSDPKTSDPTIPFTDNRAIDLMAGIKADSMMNPADTPDPAVIEGIEKFSRDLLLSSLSGNDGNIMISPVSVFLALAMTVNGADGETRTAMLDVIAGQNMTVEQVNKASQSWLGRLAKSEEKTKVSLAQSIWFRDDFRPYQPFLQANANYFSAGAYALDFSDEKAKDTINSWIKTTTFGLIEKLIDKISPTTVMFLINTVYFKSDWATPFEKHETYPQDFHAPDNSVETDFMHRTGPVDMIEFPDAVGIALPYANDQFVYFALLPDESVNPRDWLGDNANQPFFQGLGDQIAEQKIKSVSLALPIYEVGYADTLNNELIELGMGIAFGGGADFSLLNEQNTKGLFISEVKHKTVIRVDEKGTEAAAATSVAINESAVSADESIVFDRPFIYGIMDLETNLPLFVGILEDPTDE